MSRIETPNENLCSVAELVDIKQIIAEALDQPLDELEWLFGSAQSIEAAAELQPTASKADVTTFAVAAAPSSLEPPVFAEVTSATSDGWPVPQGLREPEIPDFPLDALSDWHRAFVENLGDQFQSGVDGPAAMSLAALSGAAANTSVTRIECDHPLQLWTLWITETGEGKSPVMGRCLQAVRAVQNGLMSEHARVARANKLQLLVERKRLADASRRAARGNETDAEAALEQMRIIAERISALSARHQPRLTTTEASPAGLVRRLAQPGQRLILATDEGSEIFGGILRRNRQHQEDIQAMLQAYSGVPIEHDRGTGSIYVDRPALTIAVSIQPNAFDQAMSVPSFHDQGLLARFLIMKPRIREEARRPPRRLLNEETEYDRRVTALLSLDPTAAPRVLRLTPDSNALLDSFAADIDRRCLGGGDLRCCKAWAGKLRGNVIRMASALTLADSPDATIIEVTMMERAQMLGSYFLGHAFALYQTRTQFLDDHNAATVLKWIQNGRRRSFKHREAVRAHSGRITGDQVAGAFDVLAQLGYVRVVPAQGRGSGRPAGPDYVVHPLLLQDD